MFVNCLQVYFDARTRLKLHKFEVCLEPLERE